MENLVNLPTNEYALMQKQRSVLQEECLQVFDVGVCVCLLCMSRRNGRVNIAIYVSLSLGFFSLVSAKTKKIRKKRMSSVSNMTNWKY